MRINVGGSKLIARFQGLITETLVEKRLGQRRPELTDELYQTWLEVNQRGLKSTPYPAHARYTELSPARSREFWKY